MLLSYCACIYPLEGIWGFIVHPKMWKMTVLPILAFIIFSAGLLYVLIAYTYNKQLELYEWSESLFWDLPDGFGHFVIIVSIVVEVTIASLVALHVLFGATQRAIIEMVLEREGYMLKLSLANKAQILTGKLKTKDKIISAAGPVLCMAITFPVHFFVPAGVSTIIWLLLNAWVHAFCMVVAFINPLKLRTEAPNFACAHFLEFNLFGITSLALTLIPVAGPIFFFSNAYGAALFLMELVDEAGVKIGDDKLMAEDGENSSSADDNTSSAEE